MFSISLMEKDNEKCLDNRHYHSDYDYHFITLVIRIVMHYHTATLTPGGFERLGTFPIQINIISLDAFRHLHILHLARVKK